MEKELIQPGVIRYTPDDNDLLGAVIKDMAMMLIDQEARLSTIETEVKL